MARGKSTEKSDLCTGKARECGSLVFSGEISRLFSFARDDIGLLMKKYYVYIMSNVRRNVLYIGVTNSLERRCIEHVHKKDETSFAVRYNTTDLLYFEDFCDVVDAINREKQLKRWSKKKKLNLIRMMNPDFSNLFSGVISSEA